MADWTRPIKGGEPIESGHPITNAVRANALTRVAQRELGAGPPGAVQGNPSARRFGLAVLDADLDTQDANTETAISGFQWVQGAGKEPTTIKNPEAIAGSTGSHVVVRKRGARWEAAYVIEGGGGGSGTCGEIEINTAGGLHFRIRCDQLITPWVTIPASYCDDGIETAAVYPPS